MSKTQGKNIKGRPGVMPTPKRAGNPRTPKPVRLSEGTSDVQEEGAEVTKPPVAEGQAVEPPVDGGDQS